MRQSKTNFFEYLKNSILVTSIRIRIHSQETAGNSGCHHTQISRRILAHYIPSSNANHCSNQALLAHSYWHNHETGIGEASKGELDTYFPEYKPGLNENMRQVGFQDEGMAYLMSGILEFLDSPLTDDETPPSTKPTPEPSRILS